MKLILSRKGFDSGENSGGCASPIFCDGSMFSLPIPDTPDFRITYDDLRHPQADIGELVQDLTHTYAKKFIESTHGAHLDPHINLATYAPNVESAEWRGLLGQARAAQSHLHNQAWAKATCSCSSDSTAPLRGRITVGVTPTSWSDTSCGVGSKSERRSRLLRR